MMYFLQSFVTDQAYVFQIFA